MYSSSNQLDDLETNEKERFFVPDTHLNSPLKTLQLRRAQVSYLSGVLGITCGVEEVTNHFRAYNISIDPLVLLKELVSSATNGLLVSSNLDHFRTLSAGVTNVNILREKFSVGLLDLKDMTVSAETGIYGVLRENFSELIKAYSVAICNSSKFSFRHQLGPLSFYFTNEYVAVYKDNSVISVSDYMFILALSDLFSARHLTFLYIDVDKWVNKEASDDLKSLIIDLYQWGDTLIRLFGNQAYDLIKHHEAICISTLQHQTSEGLDLAEDFSKFIKTSYEEALLSLSSAANLGLTPALFHPLHRPSRGYIKDEALVQIFGLYRHWGHPYVLSSLGIAANRKVAGPRKTISRSASEIISAASKELIFFSFFYKKKRYPFYEIITKRENYLQECLQYNRPIVAHVDAVDWADIELKQCYNPIAHLSTLDVINDKACGVSRSEVKQELLSKKRSDWQKRRVLCNYLRNPEPNPYEFLLQVDKDGGLPSEQLTIGVTPKERELKTKPRLFSLMSMPLKLYFGYTEALLAKTILKLIPEITLTDDLLSVTKKQIKMNNKHSDWLDPVRIIVNMDFEKWNLNFRSCNTIPMFEQLDALFGFKCVYSITHDLFKKTLFYCADGEEWPTPDQVLMENGELVWTEQEGGCEGLRQKGWTLLTVAVLKYILKKDPVTIALMGQGDNQVLSITFNRWSRKMKSEKKPLFRIEARRVLHKIFDFFDSLGLPIKREETWASGAVYAYSKLLIVRGVPMSMSLKRISRCFHLANEDYPSLYNSIASIFANAQSAAYNSHTYEVSYLIAMSEAHKAFRYHFMFSPLLGAPLFSGKISMSIGNKSFTYSDLEMEECLFRLLQGNVEFGGYPVQNPLDFLSKGFPDKVTSYLTWCDMVRQSIICPTNLKEIYACWCDPMLSSTANMEKLLTNPGSINTVKATDKVTVMRSAVKDTLLHTGYVLNDTFAQLLAVSEEKNVELMDTLKLIRPYHSRYVADLYASTLQGQVQSFVDKFTTTKTLRGVARMYNYKLLTRIQRSETQMLAMAYIQSSIRGGNANWDCPTCFADELRYKGWGIEITGCTVAHPIHQFKTDTTQSKETILLVTRSCENNHSMFTTLGYCVPYLGSQTHETIPQASDYQLNASVKGLKDAIHGLRVINWLVEPSDKLAELIVANVESYTDLPLSFLLRSDFFSEANWENRFEDRYTSHGGYINNLYGPHTHLRTIITHAKNKKTLQVLMHNQVAVSVLNTMHVLLSKNGANLPILAFSLNCHYCSGRLQPQTLSLGNADINNPCKRVVSKNIFWYPKELLIPLLEYQGDQFRVETVQYHSRYRTDAAVNSIAFYLAKIIYTSRDFDYNEPVYICSLIQSLDCYDVINQVRNWLWAYVVKDAVAHSKLWGTNLISSMIKDRQTALMNIEEATLLPLSTLYKEIRRVSSVNDYDVFDQNTLSGAVDSKCLYFKSELLRSGINSFWEIDLLYASGLIRSNQDVAIHYTFKVLQDRSLTAEHSRLLISLGCEVITDVKSFFPQGGNLEILDYVIAMKLDQFGISDLIVRKEVSVKIRSFLSMTIINKTIEFLSEQCLLVAPDTSNSETTFTVKDLSWSRNLEDWPIEQQIGERATGVVRFSRFPPIGPLTSLYHCRYDFLLGVANVLLKNNMSIRDCISFQSGLFRLLKPSILLRKPTTAYSSAKIAEDAWRDHLDYLVFSDMHRNCSMILPTKQDQVEVSIVDLTYSRAYDLLVEWLSNSEDLSSTVFLLLPVEIPETSNFLDYLNNSGYKILDACVTLGKEVSKYWQLSLMSKTNTPQSKCWRVQEEFLVRRISWRSKINCWLSFVLGESWITYDIASLKHYCTKGFLQYYILPFEKTMRLNAGRNMISDIKLSLITHITYLLKKPFLSGAAKLRKFNIILGKIDYSEDPTYNIELVDDLIDLNSSISEDNDSVLIDYSPALLQDISFILALDGLNI